MSHDLNLSLYGPAADIPAKRDVVVDSVPFFYGWVMLPIAMLGVIATSPGQTYGISVFNDSFRHDLGTKSYRLELYLHAGHSGIASAPITYFGRLMDRFGIRPMMTIAVILLGLDMLCGITSDRRGHAVSGLS